MLLRASLFRPTAWLMFLYVFGHASASFAEQAQPAQAQELSAQLIDIELPAQPGTNWWLGLEIGLAVFGILLLLGLLYWLQKRYWRRFRLRWQLKALSKNWTSLEPDDERTEALKLYQVFDDAKRHQLLFETDVVALKAQLEPLCFSSAHASRETLQAVLIHFQQALSAHQKHQLKVLPKETWGVLKRWICLLLGVTLKTQSPCRENQNDR